MPSGGRKRTDPVSNCSTDEGAGKVACRSAQGQPEFGGAEGLSAGVGLSVGLGGGSDWSGQQGQHLPGEAGRSIVSAGVVVAVEAIAL